MGGDQSHQRMKKPGIVAEPVKIGEVMTGGAVAEVIESRNPAYQTGDIVEGMLGWQKYAVSSGAELRKIDPSIAPVSTALGVLGMPGLTAYFAPSEASLSSCVAKTSTTSFPHGTQLSCC